MAPTDFLFDPVTGDILISRGDLVVADSTRQHQFDLVMSDKGAYKHQPRRGVGIRNYLNDSAMMPGLTSSIRSELSADGQTVDEVKIEPGGQVTITASF